MGKRRLKSAISSIAGLLEKSARPLIMGVLNATPDSFSDGGRWLETDTALRHAISLVAAGADIIDIGGESTRPGAGSVTAEEEIGRVLPLVERLSNETPVLISIDTSKPAVMRAAVRAGAGMINDVRALQAEGALDAATELQVPVCLMHMRGQPRDMQQAPVYGDVVADVERFLLARAQACQTSGIPASAIVIDPGFGFGKTLQHNLELFRAIPRFAASGYSLMIGVSRKSMLGQITGASVEDRDVASAVAAVLAARSGASVLRVHNVRATRAALQTAAQLDPSSTAPEGLCR